MKKKCSNKKCKHGGVPQETSNFHRKSVAADGLSSECKDCNRDRSRLNQQKRAREREQVFNLFL